MVVRSITVRGRKWRWRGDKFLYSSPSVAGGAIITWTSFTDGRKVVDVPEFWVMENMRWKIKKAIEDALDYGYAY